MYVHRHSIKSTGGTYFVEICLRGGQEWRLPVSCVCRWPQPRQLPPTCSPVSSCHWLPRLAAVFPSVSVRLVMLIVPFFAVLCAVLVSFSCFFFFSYLLTKKNAHHFALCSTSAWGLQHRLPGMMGKDKFHTVLVEMKLPGRALWMLWTVLPARRRAMKGIQTTT